MRRKTKFIVAGVVLALLALGGLAFASPYLAVRGMRQAAQAQDAAKLSEYVDFPALRQSLKDDFSGRLTEELRKDPKNPLAAIGLMFGASIVSQLVDAFTTPENLVRLMQGRIPQGPAAVFPFQGPSASEAAAQPANQSADQSASPSMPQSTPQPGPQPSPQPASQPAPQAEQNAMSANVGAPAISMGYEGMNRFVVRVRDKKPGAGPLVLELRRDGVFSWKLCAVQLPN
ncbi:DUF2939 domain-containing protein [Humidesulfovibrio idahonensis]